MKPNASGADSKGRDEDSQDEVFDFLGLPDCITLRLDQVEQIFLAQAMFTPRTPDVCPECGGSWSSESKGKMLDPFLDIPRGSSPVVIEMMVLSPICMDCKRSPSVMIPWLDETRQMTHRLMDFILDRVATLSPFSEIALDALLDESTVKDMFVQEFRAFDQERGKNLPRVLQLDEVYFGDRRCTVIVDGETGDAVDLLDGLKSEIIRARFKAAGNREAVEYVIQDFSATLRSASAKPPGRTGKSKGKKRNTASEVEPPEGEQLLLSLLFPVLDTETADSDGMQNTICLSRDALAEILPNAKIVGDHFHLKKAIEEGFDKIRIHVHDKLVDRLYKKIRRGYHREEVVLKGEETIRKEAKAEASRLAKEGIDALVEDRHVLSKRLENVEGDEQGRLKRMLILDPLLSKGWDAKERGLRIFPVKPPPGKSTESRRAGRAERAALLMDDKDAAQRLDEWITFVESEGLEAYFARPLRLIKNWREEIIRIGTTGYSNAGAEQKNRYLRTINMIGRGYSFDVLRARMVWADAHRRASRWPAICDGEEGTMTLSRFVRLAKDIIARKECINQSEARDISSATSGAISAGVAAESNE